MPPGWRCRSGQATVRRTSVLRRSVLRRSVLRRSVQIRWKQRPGGTWRTKPKWRAYGRHLCPGTWQLAENERNRRKGGPVALINPPCRGSTLRGSTERYLNFGGIATILRQWRIANNLLDG